VVATANIPVRAVRDAAIARPRAQACQGRASPSPSGRAEDHM